ncbi:MAG: sigma-54 dependent transcriptional regulator [Bacteroidota bacterium]|nr:sigma-54 dependent transcriptional regulator [Bacteroidota bacterium]MDE2957343.1 sigma-54 dependent transcriptional regulator [Bacteroidota bacterium]
MAAPRILVVDDEASIRRALREILEYESFEVIEAADGAAALDCLRKSSFDAVLLDIKMPRKDGLEVLSECVEAWPELPVIMISGHADIRTAVEATRQGAFHFIEKPPDLQHLLVTVRSALKKGKLVVENRRLRQTLAQSKEKALVPILGESAAIRQTKDTLARVAPTEARVLITGEPGTGKELAARWIHHGSPRSEGPMIAVNCAAIPAELIESELFGHEKGSFTGAVKRRIGKFEQADRGTLFLDEIGDMSLSAQAKVLRALQENRITRVGGDRAIKVDVRIIAATNKDLRKSIADEAFREDLYHRLSVILVPMPPLRERTGDVSILLKHFARQLARRNGLAAKKFAPKAVRALSALPWPGNVREISNVVERLLILSRQPEITARDVARYVQPTSGAAYGLSSLMEESCDLGEFRDRAEKMFLHHKLESNDWDVRQTARALGMQSGSLAARMRKFNLGGHA